ncbi:MAG: ribose-phosphate diphosphokinase [Polaromonas sp.]
MLLFALEPQDKFSTALAVALDVPISPHEDRSFADGECKLRPLVDPRGADAYVVYSLHGGPALSPHDKLARLLMFIATLHDHGAARITAVVPYLAYARKDRQTKPWDPVTLRYVAQLLEAVGTAQIIVLEVHNVAAFQNAFRCPTLHLEAHQVFEALASEMASTGPIAVASPDPGGVKRAQLWRESLEQRLQCPIGFAMVEKRRSAGRVSGGERVAGDVAGATVLLLDDLIATGETMQRAALALRAAGAKEMVAFAAHGLFIDPAGDVLGGESMARWVVTDSVPPFRLDPASPAGRKLQVVSSVPLFAEAIRKSHCAWRH